ncbi:hypothetical protein ACP70R_015189 [Stipagrostis hirtigluma subsp. patula]
MAPPPPLVDDVVGEILLRVPPDEPSHLVRAAAVCKPWRRILTDPAFLRRYRAFHRTPPLLGVLHNFCTKSAGCFIRFVPTTAASPCSPLALDRGSCWALDCRHGRVLIHSYSPSGLVVWDPITGAVLCATDGCDHLDCRGGPFLVVFMGTDLELEEDATWASVYSSETGDWSASTTIHLDSSSDFGPSLLAGDALYFNLRDGHGVLKYDLVGHGLSVIEGPKVAGAIVMTAEDGRLGFASVEDYSLYLWSWKTGAEGIAGWVQCRVIELNTVVPFPDMAVSLDLVSFAEGMNSIFISTSMGIFAVELKSGQVRKVLDRGRHKDIIPYMTFYTPGVMPDLHLHEDARLESIDICLVLLQSVRADSLGALFFIIQ